MNRCALGTPPLPITRFPPSFNLCHMNRRLPQSRLIGPMTEKQPLQLGSRSSAGTIKITMRDRSKNRKPLQRGRNLSIEAIQTIQSLKRAAAAAQKDHGQSLDRVLASSFKRLLKNDMMAALQELLRQNECLLALKVFEEVQKEYWYKPRVLIYVDIISALGSNGLYERADLLFRELKSEPNLEPETEGFNVLLKHLTSLDITGLAMECFYLMKSLGCEPDKSSFRMLINGLESKGETGLSAIIRQEAEKYYGKHLVFLEEKEELIGS